MRIEIDKIALPDFGYANERPNMPTSLYEKRTTALCERMREEALDAIVVYGDREHFANLFYLSGFDLRFEEGLFVLTREGRKTLILGNECFGVRGDVPLACDILLCQEFSLPGQDRSLSWDLRPLLNKAGVARGMKIGLIGWKPLREGRIEVPAYIVDLLTEESGNKPVNRADLLMDVVYGMRKFNEPEMLAFFEFSAGEVSKAVLNAMRSMRVGMPEYELGSKLYARGLQHAVHAMVSFGKTIVNGMAPPGETELEYGDCATFALGSWGNLTCRAGLAVHGSDGYCDPRGKKQFAVMRNYLSVVRAWYGGLAVGAKAGDVFAAADAARDKSLYEFCVNTGHYGHTDEWMHSPFAKGDRTELTSGLMLQADIIPVADGVCVNMEDALLLADSALRRDLAVRYPDMMIRCEKRRSFMRDILGYDLSDDVLPLGCMPGAYFPYLLDSRYVCRLAK